MIYQQIRLAVIVNNQAYRFKQHLWENDLVKSSIKMLQSYRIFGIAVLDFLRLRRLLSLVRYKSW